MPKIQGMKAYAISGLLRDLPDSESDEKGDFCGIPEQGVASTDEIDEEELMPHYFVPNFIRPVPEADEDPDLVEG